MVKTVSIIVLIFIFWDIDGNMNSRMNWNINSNYKNFTGVNIVENRNLKKLLGLGLTTGLILAACGNGGDTEESSAGSEESTSTDDFSIVMVTDIGGVDDGREEEPVQLDRLQLVIPLVLVAGPLGDLHEGVCEVVGHRARYYGHAALRRFLLN